MKKNKPAKKSKAPSISPEEALRFLEDILRSVKLKAKADGKKYQSLIVEYLRKGLRAGY